MAGFLTGAGAMLGGGGNQGQYAQQAWQTGQFMPYNLNTPGANISYANNQVTGSLNPANQAFYNSALQTATNNLNGPSTYNPNTSFLPGQYNSIYGNGNFQNNVNSQFNALANGQLPFLQKTMTDTFDNEFSKGTLASTAGGYQTAGAQLGIGNILGQDYSQAFNQATQQANSQFAAAQGTANLGEQQAEFGPQFAQQQTQGLFSDALNTNALMGQQALQGGQLGALQSSANTNALSPLIQSGINQDQNTASLLNGLLFGGGASGNGGFLGGLLGGGGSGQTGGQSGGGGLLSSLAGKAGNYAKNLLTGSGYSLPSDIAGMAAGNYGTIAGLDSLGSFGSSLGAVDSAGIGTSQFGGLNTFAGAFDDALAGNSTDLAGLGGDFGSAGGQAAATGAETGSEAGATGATTGAGAEGGASGGLSSGAGAALAFAPLAITAELAMHTHAVQLGDSYWQGFKNPTGSYGTPGNYTQNFLQLAEGLNRGDMPPDYIMAQYPGLMQAASQMSQLQSAPMSAYYGRGGFGNVPRSGNRA